MCAGKLTLRLAYAVAFKEKGNPDNVICPRSLFVKYEILNGIEQSASNV